MRRPGCSEASFALEGGLVLGIEVDIVRKRGDKVG